MPGPNEAFLAEYSSEEDARNALRSATAHARSAEHSTEEAGTTLSTATKPAGQNAMIKFHIGNVPGADWTAETIPAGMLSHSSAPFVYVEFLWQSDPNDRRSTNSCDLRLLTQVWAALADRALFPVRSIAT